MRHKTICYLMTFTAEQIAGFVGGTVEGDPQMSVRDFAKIEEAGAGALTFLSDAHYEHFLYEGSAAAVLVHKDFQPSQPVGATLIRVDDPRAAVGQLLTLYEQMRGRKTGVSPLACVAESAVLGADCYVGPYAVVGEDVHVGDQVSIHAGTMVGDGVQIGAESVLYPRVVIYHGCRLGKRVVVHAGAVIGADGFGFAPTAEGYQKIPQVGIVVVEDDVEIGANACIDRSTMGATIIRRGVKIDNLVQIAHNVEVGEHTVMSAQAGIAGSAKIGRWCMLGGQVGVAGHISVGDHTQVGAQAGITGGNLAARGGAVMQGSPAIEHSLFARSSVALKQLPELVREVSRLRKEIDELKRTCNDK